MGIIEQVALLITWKGLFNLVIIKQQPQNPKSDLCQLQCLQQQVSVASTYESVIYSSPEMLQKERGVIEFSEECLTYFAEYICEV